MKTRSSGSSPSQLVGVLPGAAALEGRLQFLTKGNSPATLLLGIYPKKLKTCPLKNLHVDVYSGN